MRRRSTRFDGMEDIRARSRIRRYSELMRMPSFEERYAYLRLDNKVGAVTFGFDRYINQKFYHSSEWRSIRDFVIVRDNGCDLAMDGRPIFDRIYIHHMNPIGVKDIELSRDVLFDMEYLICVSQQTHNAIHYGTDELLSKDPIIRKPGDTCPWRGS